jgi:hypothetical protein
LKKSRPLMAIISTVILGAPVVHAQTPANFQAPSTSIFTLVPTPHGHPKPYQNDLHSVSASSSGDIWAVGQTGMHFDGTKPIYLCCRQLSWAGKRQSTEGVVDFAPNNVWAVGFSGISLGHGNQVIEHFDGSKWSLFPGPKFQSTDQPALESLTAVCPRDMWAGGFILTNNGQSLFPLFEQFDGMSWKAFETFDQGAAIYGVSADANNDVWAGGTLLAFGATVIEHFNGTSWSVVSSPSPGLGEDVLTGVTALAPNNVWAVGFYAKDVNTDRPTKTLIEHWDGSSWKVASSPSIGPHSVYQSNHLCGITTVSANDVWAFGDYYAADGSGQSLRWCCTGTESTGRLFLAQVRSRVIPG